MTPVAHWVPGSRNNFAVLFSALLLISVVGPILSVSLGEAGFWVAEASFVFALVVALWGVSLSRAVLVFGVGLVFVSGSSLLVAIWQGSLIASRLSDFTALMFLVVCVFAAGFDVFRRDKVNLNKVLGGLCIYILLGVMWGISYRLLEQMAPGSLDGLEAMSGTDLRWSMFYFSFVTLTTLGYGDISPVSVFAQTLVSLQAVLGQFYLAVMVAGLVGSYLSDRDQRDAVGRNDEPES